jgi:predicted transport protein
MVNLDFVDIDDPSGLARDASNYAFITNSSESGDVIFSLRDASQVQAAIHVVFQAYERVTK